MAALPTMFDFAGAVSNDPIREREIRWDQPMGKHFKLGVNAEDPNGQLYIPTVGGTQVADVSNPLPDFTVRGLYTRDWGHLQASGMLRKFETTGASGAYSDDSAIGWNAFLSGKFKTFGEDKLGFGVTYGKGMGRWRTALNGLDQDAVLTTSGLETVKSYGGFVNYQHLWNPDWSTSLMYSYLKADNPKGSPDSFIEKTNYGLANLIWHASPVMDFSLEYTYVDRKNENGAFGKNNRIAMIFIYKFHPDRPDTSAYEDVNVLFGGR